VNLQYFISTLAAYYPTIPAVDIDGVFGEGTRDAVIAAQKTFGLTPDGLVGEDTWNAISNAYQGIIERIPTSFTDGNILPYPGVPLREGDESEFVRVLQEYLNYISQFINEIPPVNPTGYFGPQTRASVIAFQNLYGINAPVPGQVGAETWYDIADLYSDLYIGGRLGEGQYPGSPVGE
jgi:peptidoglycan hydrolase-like protein with peptidoglycan-binding domain